MRDLRRHDRNWLDSWPSSAQRPERRNGCASALGALFRGAEPAASNQTAEEPDDEPVRAEAAPRTSVGEEDARLRLEPRALAVRERTEIHRHLRVARLTEADKVLAGPEIAAPRPRPSDQRQRLGIVEPEAAGLHRRPDRHVPTRPQPAEAEEHRHQRNVLGPDLPRRRERDLRRGADPDRVVLAMVVDRQRIGDRHPAILANGENRPMRVALVVLALLAAAPAQAGVRVVAPFDPADYADRAAVGLLVPGAGPTVTREAALAALLRGKLEHGLLGGIAAGENRIELGAPGGPVILVSLPPPGRSDNDMRYPIALLGERGLLTSDSTRIDGLVSVTDVATGRLRVVENDDPAQALEELDDRIERNSDWRLPLTIALAALLIALAVLRPRYALRALLVALAANLWLSPLLALATAVAVLLLPLGWACAAILLAYLVSMGLDPETVALSPFGPSQSGRFYGINNLLETMLLAPALLGAALLGRAGLLVAGLAFVTIGGNRFGADGGGIVVLAVAYLVLWLRLRGEQPSWRLAGLVAAGAVALALALLGLDAATGGSSHVTDAVGDGPAPLAGDIADRIELSVRRTAASLGATVVVLGSLAILVAVALRARRSPVLDAFLVGIAVSLVVNDTPGDVLGMGAAIAIALARYTPERGWLSSGPMRRAAALLLLLACSLGLAGCGGEEVVIADARDDRRHASRRRRSRRSRRPSPSRPSRATPRTAPKSSPRPAAAAATRSRRPGRRATSAPTSTTPTPIRESWSSASPTARA